jgi:hypothetical protein
MRWSQSFSYQATVVARMILLLSLYDDGKLVYWQPEEGGDDIAIVATYT